jgi:Domain of unknown function (DU1801)
MQSKATTVEQYLAELPTERRAAIEAVRKVILANLDSDFEEGMQYGMIGYYVPHHVYPAGYHCDPRQPLPYAALASQKNCMSLYMMCIYGGGDLLKWFEQEWARSGKKLDFGKCCVRFKKIEDVALDVVGELFRRVPAKKYIAHCEAASQAANRRKPQAKGRAPRGTGAAKSGKATRSAGKRPRSAK